MPGYNWLIQHNPTQLIGNNPNPNIRNAAFTIFSFISEFKLKQLNNFINGSNNTLDLFLTKSDCNLKACESQDPLSPIDRHHSAHILNLQIDKNTRNFNKKILYNFTKRDYNKINYHLNLVNWNQIKNQSNDVDQFLDSLYQHLYSKIELYIPKIKCNYNPFPRFFSNELVINIIEKRKMLFLYKFTNIEKFKEKHKSLRALCKVLRKRD